MTTLKSLSIFSEYELTIISLLKHLGSRFDYHIESMFSKKYVRITGVSQLFYDTLNDLISKGIVKYLKNRVITLV